jgi:hypothetical protein
MNSVPLPSLILWFSGYLYLSFTQSQGYLMIKFSYRDLRWWKSKVLQVIEARIEGKSKELPSSDMHCLSSDGFACCKYDLCQLNNDNNHSRIIFRKKRKQRMYWSTQMNEFLRNAIINLDLDYKAIVSNSFHLMKDYMLQFHKLLNILRC